MTAGQGRGIAERGRLAAERDLDVVGLTDPSHVLDGFGAHLAEVDAGLGRRSGGAGARQVEQVHREHLQPLDLLERRLEGGGDGGAVAREQGRQLQLSGGDRDRGAELVTGVVEEGALVVERGLDPRQHVVQVAGQLGELGRALHGQATAASDRQGIGFGDHRAHGAERGADDEPGGRDDDHRECRQRDGERERQLVLRPLVLVE